VAHGIRGLDFAIVFAKMKSVLGEINGYIPLKRAATVLADGAEFLS